MNPRQQALAYRIWALAEPVGWDLTPTALAEELDVSVQQVRWILRKKGWSTRVRAEKKDMSLVLRDDEGAGLWD